MARKPTQKFRHPFPILIAEDHPTTRRILEKIVINAGYETVSVGNGRKALELFNERFFPIIIADWVMPEMDGIELCRAIRKNVTTRYVYILLVTVRESKDDIISGLEAGADDYLTKPFHHAELVARLNTGKRILELERSLREANERSKREIEQRKRAERNLRAAKRQLEATNQDLEEAIERANQMVVEAELASVEVNQIFNTAADGMRVIDKDFNVLRINGALSNLSRISEAEAVGKKCYDGFPSLMCHTDRCPLSRILGGEKRVECEVEKERSDGSRIPCIVTATPFRGLDGELIGIVENCKDVTERKRAEAVRERLIEELQEALARVKTLSGLLPICASCKKIRDDKGYWNQIETYIEAHSEADFSHSICPECARKLYPELYHNNK